MRRRVDHAVGWRLIKIQQRRGGGEALVSISRPRHSGGTGLHHPDQRRSPAPSGAYPSSSQEKSATSAADHRVGLQRGQCLGQAGRKAANAKAGAIIG